MFRSWRRRGREAACAHEAAAASASPVSKSHAAAFGSARERVRMRDVANVGAGSRVQEGGGERSVVAHGERDAGEGKTSLLLLFLLGRPHERPTPSARPTLPPPLPPPSRVLSPSTLAAFFGVDDSIISRGLIYRRRKRSDVGGRAAAATRQGPDSAARAGHALEGPRAPTVKCSTPVFQPVQQALIRFRVHRLVSPPVIASRLVAFAR
jgi:hypothetical protein